MVKPPALSPAYCVLVRTMSAKGYLPHNGGALFSFPEATRADYSEEVVRRPKSKNHDQPCHQCVLRRHRPGAMRSSAKPLPSGKSLPAKCLNGGNGYIATVGIEESGKEDEREMKTSNANKVISVLMSVAMCPMMVPSAAFAADDDTASGGVPHPRLS